MTSTRCPSCDIASLSASKEVCQEGRLDIVSNVASATSDTAPPTYGINFRAGVPNFAYFASLLRMLSEAGNASVSAATNSVATSSPSTADHGANQTVVQSVRFSTICPSRVVLPLPQGPIKPKTVEDCPTCSASIRVQTTLTNDSRPSASFPRPASSVQTPFRPASLIRQIQVCKCEPRKVNCVRTSYRSLDLAKCDSDPICSATVEALILEDSVHDCVTGGHQPGHLPALVSIYLRADAPADLF